MIGCRQIGRAGGGDWSSGRGVVSLDDKVNDSERDSGPPAMLVSSGGFCTCSQLFLISKRSVVPCRDFYVSRQAAAASLGNHLSLKQGQTGIKEK